MAVRPLNPQPRTIRVPLPYGGIGLSAEISSIAGKVDAFTVVAGTSATASSLVVSREQAVDILRQTLKPFFRDVHEKYRTNQWLLTTPAAKRQGPFYRALKSAVEALDSAMTEPGDLTSESLTVLGTAPLFAEQFLAFLPPKSQARRTLQNALPSLKGHFPSRALLPATYLYDQSRSQAGWTPPSAKSFRFNLRSFSSPEVAVSTSVSMVSYYRLTFVEALQQLNISTLDDRLHDEASRLIAAWGELANPEGVEAVAPDFLVKTLEFLDEHFDRIPNRLAKFGFVESVDDLLKDDGLSARLPQPLKEKLADRMNFARGFYQRNQEELPENYPEKIRLDDDSFAVFQRFALLLSISFPDAAFLETLSLTPLIEFRTLQRLLAAFAQFYPQIPKSADQGQLTNALKKMLAARIVGPELSGRFAEVFS